MTLWIQLLFGDPIPIDVLPPLRSWRPVYQLLQARLCPEKKIHQLRLYDKGSTDLSHVPDGGVLHLIVSEPMVERWVSEFTLPSKVNDTIQFHQSTLAWYDARWGDPYEDKKVQYRTALVIHVLAKERKGECYEFTVNPEYFKELYGNKEHQKDTIWYSTLREACYAYRKELYEKNSEETMTEKTCEHLVHLWELYHGTNQHLVDQGRYYDY